MIAFCFLQFLRLGGENSEEAPAANGATSEAHVARGAPALARDTHPRTAQVPALQARDPLQPARVDGVGSRIRAFRYLDHREIQASAMEDYIEVGGARIERSYFEESVAEAREMSWHPATVPDQDEHVHCFICWKAIPWEPKPRAAVFRSRGGWLCGDCHGRLILPHDLAESY